MRTIHSLIQTPKWSYFAAGAGKHPIRVRGAHPTLLIHGARSAIIAAKDRDDRLSCWIQSLCSRRNKNIAAVALANKTMRMAWALLKSGADYDPDLGRRQEGLAIAELA